MPEDVGTLLKLARMVYFINLPPDERILEQKVAQSRECFLRLAMEEAAARSSDGARRGLSGYASDASDMFMFSIEDPESGGVVGTSQVKARMGGPGNPNYSFRLTRREFHSRSLGVGTTHLIARLYEDESGPTEVGGLILAPSLRGHRAKPGRFLAFVRFHFIGLHRAAFADRILAEMMARVSSEGDNLFWDHIGRKFIPVRYSEADRFCQHNRTFIDELMPKDDLYLSLLPLEVLNQVGQVGPETAPARRLLEKLGFEYKGFIDPFDGGPHLEAVTDHVPLVRDTRWTTVGGTATESKRSTFGIVSVLDEGGEFLAINDWVQVDSAGRVCLTEAQKRALQAQSGAEVGITPMPGERGGPAGVGEQRKRSGRGGEAAGAAADAGDAGRKPRRAAATTGKKKTKRRADS